MRKRYKRILLKLSGEAFLKEETFGINSQACKEIAVVIRDLRASGLEVAVVLGAGNLFRGMQLVSSTLSHSEADQMGMLSTILNGIALQSALRNEEVPTCLMTALQCPQVVESYHYSKALRCLEKQEVVIFVGGTGNPYFTTDTAAALRASEMRVELLLKATKVSGVYNKDPSIHETDVFKYQRVSYEEVLKQNLKVMDATAISLCRNQNIPIFVFHMKKLFERDFIQKFPNFENGTLVN